MVTASFCRPCENYSIGRRKANPKPEADQANLLRMWHVKIEAWILEQAGIDFLPAAPGFKIVVSA
jgi:hypothetical protein